MTWTTAADWGGSIAAAGSIVCLFRASLWYWYLSIVATTLWFALFLATDSLIVAGLQLSYTLFALYGIARWWLEARGRLVPGWLDHLGAAVAFGILAATVAVTDFAGWQSWVELAAVALAIAANWLTAQKVIWCWPVWISTNVLFGLLFWDAQLWGLFLMQFVYAALSVAGFAVWRCELITSRLAPA
jgi:nicotinamide mononucleotide transporter